MVDDVPYERIVVNIQTSLLKKLSVQETDLSACFFMRPLGSGNIQHLNEEQKKEFLGLYESLKTALSKNDFGHIIQRNAYLSLLLVLINSFFRENTNEKMSIMPQYIMDTMNYIEEHIGESLSLEKIERRLNYNKKYLSGRFKQHTGMTLRSYILDRRISHAKSLLRNNANVSEACFHSGFNDYANFLRSFKKLEGITPGEYKKANV